PGGPSTFATSATIGLDSASGASATNIGVDPSDCGAGNFKFPPCDIRLIPTFFSGGEGDYSATSTTVPQEPFCSIAATGIAVGPNCAGICYDDDNSSLNDGAEIPLPWKFNLLGRAMCNATMNANGFLQLSPGQWAASPGAVVLPSVAEPDATLAPFWDDLEGTLASGMFYSVVGSPGCRVMTFEWSNFEQKAGVARDCVTGGGLISFQVKLFEGSAGSLAASVPPCPYDTVVPGNGNDRIEFHYDHAGFVAPAVAFSATTGWENHKGTIGASFVCSPACTGPPVLGGVPQKGVVDQCDFGTLRFYGDRNFTPAGAACCLPELKGNCVPPRIGNPFGLALVGGTPGAAGFFILGFGGPLPGLRTPVPCGGLPSPFGTFWVNPFLPSSFLFACGALSAGGPCEGCCTIDLPIPLNPALVGFKVFAQGAALTAVCIELTEGAAISIGA
ncbi:MAG TPA: hypothetical protein VKF62_05115, partial [Planctomycetota bacterium]|nr:hypothetical protein [Planctomycetota bacterium]